MPALLAYQANMEAPFRIWTGNIDLLEMAREVSEEAFRNYIALSREIRKRLRTTLPSPV